MEPNRTTGKGWRSAAAGLLCGLLVAALLSACGEEQKEDELNGTIGPGSGGVPVTQATVVSDTVTTPAGTRVGALDYDAGYWSETFSGGGDDSIAFVYENAADALAIVVVRINGRPDTPCRFEAAVLARDEGFEVLASGDVFNDQGLEFHQVNLAKGGVEQRFFCTDLNNNVGIEFSITSGVTGHAAYEQVHFILNSVRQ
jgi:hypothetical protein